MRKGRFELSHQGTLFLDEIGEMPSASRPSCCGCCRSGIRTGGRQNTTIKVDVRVVAATNRDLKQEVAAGRFREDLYYRLNVVHIHVPP
jgi:transcriptional regulator with GAF, ATPase, and Fis domain